MNKSYLLFLPILLVIVSLGTKVAAQQKHQDFVAAVVGEEVVLHSDIVKLQALSSANDNIKELNDCEILENSVLDKALLHKAKKDSTIVASRAEVEKKVNQLLTQYGTHFGDDQKVLDFFGYRTFPELRDELEQIEEDRIKVETLRRRISKNKDVTPKQIKEFYEKHKNDLPSVPDQVGIAHIVFAPKITEKNILKTINQLSEVKSSIEKGELTFEDAALLYSQDPGSKNKGGLYQGIKRGSFVKEFEETAFSLSEGEISEPFKTDFGYHIVQLIKKEGNSMDVRHVLLQLTPEEAELTKSNELAEKVREEISSGTISFEKAAKLYSSDEKSKFNGGRISQNGVLFFEKEKLPIQELVIVGGLQKGDISFVSDYGYKNRPAFRIIKLVEEIPSHPINLKYDYPKIKKLVLNQESRKQATEWVKQNSIADNIEIRGNYKVCQFKNLKVL